MINAYFGITHLPFSEEEKELLPHQNAILEALKVDRFQRGLCLVAGDPGTGKSLLKEAFAQDHPKQVTPQIGRTRHTYSNTLRLLCEALGIEYEGGDLKCERQVIEATFRLNQLGKALALLIDDAHLLELQHLRKLRLLFEEMPHNDAIIRFAQSDLLAKLALGLNADLRTGVSYSALLPKLTAEDLEAFILGECDRCGLAHHRLDPAALRLIAQSAEGILRHAVNLTLSSLLQAVRAQAKTVTIDHVNTVLRQPHGRDHEHWLHPPNG